MTAHEELHALVNDLDEDGAALWLQFMRTGDPLPRSFRPTTSRYRRTSRRLSKRVGRHIVKDAVVSADELRQRSPVASEISNHNNSRRASHSLKC